MADEIKNNEINNTEINNTEELEGNDADTVQEERSLVTLTDEDGTETEFELIGRLTLNGNDYIALMTEDNNEEYLILRSEKDENGDEYFVTIEDDDEFDAAADAFDDEFMSEIDFDLGADTQD